MKKKLGSKQYKTALAMLLGAMVLISSARDVYADDAGSMYVPPTQEQSEIIEEEKITE